MFRLYSYDFRGAVNVNGSFNLYLPAQKGRVDIITCKKDNNRIRK